ncbi:MAG: GAD-like domain-containing protein [Pseudomonadota bacterium]
MSDFSDDLRDFRAMKGPVIEGGEASLEAVDRLRETTPEGYADFISEHGFDQYLGGYCQLCDPTALQPVVDGLFKRETDIRPDETVAIAYSAMGHLILWNVQHRAVIVDFNWLHVSCPSLLRPKPEIAPSITFTTTLFFLDGQNYAGVDENGKDLFPQIKAIHGIPSYGQIFAPRLHPALGGYRRADNYRPVAASTAFSLMLSAGPFILMDNKPFPPKPVREIGG